MGRHRALCSQARHKSADSSPEQRRQLGFILELGQNIACCADFDCFVMLALRVNWCIPLLSVVLIDDGPQCCEFDAAKSVTTLPHIRGTLKLYPHRKLTENRTRHAEWLMMMCGEEEGGGKRQKLDDGETKRYRVTSFLPIVHSQVPPHTLILGKCSFHSKSFETRYITMHKTNDCPFIFKELCQA